MTNFRRSDAMRSKATGRYAHILVAVCAALLLVVTAASQTGSANPELKERVAALKQSAAANQQRLHKYQWTEIQQVTYKGDTKPEKTFMCQYGPDGKVQKTPLNQGQQQQPSGGRLKQRIIEKKKEEMADYMGDVKSVLALYVPPNPQKMQQAMQAGKVSLSRDGGSGLVNITFKDYAQPGDQMVIAFDPTAKKITNLNVNTYMGKAKDAVTLMVNFSTLPDGTNYAEKTVLNAAAKQIVVTTTNVNYHQLGM